MRKLTKDEFVEKANLIHNNKYSYNKFEYCGYNLKGIIICNLHGEFLQSPGNHLHGKSCYHCGLLKFSVSKTSTTNEFKEKSNAIHQNKYCYDLVEYKNAKTKVKILCKAHGLFLQEPKHHLSNIGCPKCSCNISKPETEWLNTLSIPLENRNIAIKPSSGRKINVDGFNSNTNTVYFFHGDFWHGNPVKFNYDDINPKTKTSFGELYDKTIAKENILKRSGYNVVSMWESEWTK